MVGPGDDAAVLATADGRVVVTTDLLVEGRHFRRDWSSADDIGRKAAAQNLADVAAMGAVPTGLLVGPGGAGGSARSVGAGLRRRPAARSASPWACPWSAVTSSDPTLSWLR